MCLDPMRGIGIIVPWTLPHVVELTDRQEVELFRVPSPDRDGQCDGASSVTFEARHGAVRSDYRWNYRVG
jgi:hypothetical protein